MSYTKVRLVYLFSLFTFEMKLCLFFLTAATNVRSLSEQLKPAEEDAGRKTANATKKNEEEGL